MTFGQRIRDLRTAKGLSQQQMASELGITPQAYSLIERDESGKTYEKLPIMARALGSTIDGLFPEMDPEEAKAPAPAVLQNDEIPFD